MVVSSHNDRSKGFSVARNSGKWWRYFSMSPRNGSCVAEVSSVRSLSSDDVSATKTNRKKSCWARATDPAHRRGRRIQLLQMLVLPFIPILALIVQTANTLHDILIYRQEVSDIETQVILKNSKIFLQLNNLFTLLTICCSFRFSLL